MSLVVQMRKLIYNLLEYYFSIAQSPSWNYFSYNAEKILQAKLEKEKDLDNLDWNRILNAEQMRYIIEQSSIGDNQRQNGGLQVKIGYSSTKSIHIKILKCNTKL